MRPRTASPTYAEGVFLLSGPRRVRMGSIKFQRLYEYVV